MTEQKQLIEGFKKEIDNQIIVFEKDLKTLSKSSKDYETYLITSLKNLDLKKRQIQDLKKFGRDINHSIKEQIKEIEQLPFVKGVRLTPKGISIDVGKVDINYRNDNIYIGDFTITITPSGVEVKNRKPIIIKDEYHYERVLEHPHIDNKDRKYICYGGERQVKINEYLAKFQLKQLVYMVYLFLKTYSERDKYWKITYWAQEAKRKVRKQKAEINIIKEEIKSEVKE
jgi:hypothetical protein